MQYVDYINTDERVNGHGTHVCGTIAGHKTLDGISGTDGFVNGVAKNAKIAFVDIGQDDRDGTCVLFGLLVLFVKDSQHMLFLLLLSSAM